MNIERKTLVIYMIGFIDGQKLGISRSDKLILLDQSLIKFNQPPITDEEKLEFLNELELEIDATLLIAGINRKQSRELARVGKTKS